MTQNVLAKHPKLRGFAQLGAQPLQESGDGGQVSMNCPFCGRPKMCANAENLLWDCKRCGKSGNFEGFLRAAAERATEDLTAEGAKRLSEARGILPQTFRAWGVGMRGGTYTVPADANAWKAEERKTTDVRLYSIGKKSMSTAGGHLSLVGPRTLRGTKRVWICEGEWDGMAWWEALRGRKIQDDVVAVVGAGNFPKEAAALFKDRDVVLLFDNDEPGQKGTLRTWNLLQGLASSLKRLQWWKGLPDKFDVRDLYLSLDRKADAVVKKVEEHLTAEPPAGSTAAQATAKEEACNGPGLSREEAFEEYRKWLHLEDSEPLDVVFGAAFANRIDADPFWIFLVGPPGSLKSELIMSLAAAPKTYALTSLTPHTLISGANFAGAGDPSLLPKLLGKVALIKDFTAILQMNQTARDEILSILRDAYDGKISKGFGNGVTREYNGKFGIIAGVTPAIESYASACTIMGERFVRYRLATRGRISAGREATLRAIRNIARESKMREHLAETARRVMDRPVPRESYPGIPEWMETRLLDLAQWVAQLRGAVARERYTQEVLYKPSAESSTRLGKQLGTFGMGAALFLGRKAVDEDAFRIVGAVARGTVPDRVEEVVRHLYSHRDEGYLATERVGELSRLPTDTARRVLQDLRLLGIVEAEAGEARGRWRLKGEMAALTERTGLYEQHAEVARSLKRARKGGVGTGPRKVRR